MDYNPWMNSVVLSEVFQFLDVPQLVKCRTICRGWYNLSKLEFRNKLMVRIGKIGDNLQWDTLTKKFDFDGGENLPRNFHLYGIEFLTPPYPTTSPPDESLYLRQALWENFQANLKHAKMYVNMESFRSIIWSQIRKLKLSYPMIYSTHVFNSAITDELPNLKDLDLEYVTLSCEVSVDEDEDDDGRIQPNMKSLTVRSEGGSIPWTLFFKRFPNIQSLKVFPVDFPGPVDEIVDSLQLIGRNGNMTIKQLVISNDRFVCSQYDPIISTLITMPHFKLEELELDATQWEEDGNNLTHTVLQHHGSTLKKLSLEFECELEAEYQVDRFPFRPHSVIHLVDLDLRGHAAPNFHFLDQLPNLQRLTLRECFKGMVERTDLGLMREITLPHLVSLSTHLVLSVDFLETIANVMPRLEDLTGEVTTDGFRVICSQWEWMRKLALSSGFLDKEETNAIGDDGISGMVAGVADRFPNLTDLKHLRQFALETTGRIGEDSVWHGFMECRNLDQLNIVLSPQISADAKKAVEDRFGSNPLSTFAYANE